MDFRTIGFIGLGLIGGSIAKSIKIAFPQTKIIAYDTNESMLTVSYHEKIIDQKALGIDAAFTECDIIFLCAPVSVNNDNLRLLKPFLRNDTLVTDVGSVKSSIHEVVKELDIESQFIGGHPMAGSEKTGVQNANPLILENAYYILTPTKTVSSHYLDSYKELVTKAGALPLIISFEEHDYITAAISHVPHLIAAALVNLVHDKDSERETMKTVAAGGFKDITRIASSSPAMWEAICMSNHENIANLLDDYIASLQEISTMIRQEKEGYTYKLFEESKEYRDSFAVQARGPIKKIFSCYVDIPDETGSISILATLLAGKNISIKNIGIIHNREFEEGVLQIEFYDQAALEEATAYLRKLDYIVYDRD